MLISFVIPCYRSEKTINSVLDEIFAVAGQRELYECEVIAVNDCSPDKVLEVLKKRASLDHRIKVIDLAKNVGKHGAVMAGYSAVQGDFVVGIDDDGQCPLDRLWDLIDPLEKGYDMAMARYDVKKQSNFKNWGSRINNQMSHLLLDKPSGMVFSNFIARKRFVCEEMARYDHPYPYLEGLSLRTTRNIALVPMQERERVSGTSGYTLKRSLKLWLNGFTAFSVWPLRFATIAGLLTAIIGISWGIVTVIRKIMFTNISAGYSSIMAALLFLGGMIMIMLGIIGEYIGRIYICINKSPQYVIREKYNL